MLKIIKAKNSIHHAKVREFSTKLLDYIGGIEPVERHYHIKKSNQAYLVMWNGKFIGSFLLGNSHNKYKYLQRLFIEESFRGKGIGRKLFKTIFEIMLDECNGLTISVSDKNMYAKNFYIKQWFREYHNIWGHTYYYKNKKEVSNADIQENKDQSIQEEE